MREAEKGMTEAADEASGCVGPAAETEDEDKDPGCSGMGPAADPGIGNKADSGFRISDDEDESFSDGSDPFTDGVDVVRVDSEAGAPADSGIIGNEDPLDPGVRPAAELLPDENLSDNGSIPGTRPPGPLFC
jgi:hypothetical protein